MSEQPAPRPGQDEATAEAVESAAVTESGPAPAAAPEVPSTPAPAPDAARAAEQEAAAGTAGEAAESAGPAETPAVDETAPAQSEPAPATERPAVDETAPAQSEPAAATEASAVDQAAPAEGEPGPEAPAPTAEAPAAGAGEQPAPAAEAPAAPEAEAQPARPAPPKPSAIPKPSALPKPSAMPRRPAAPGTPVPAPAVVAPVPDDAREAAAAAAWGRVDPDGTVWVREAAGERSVGQYAGADTEEALAFYVRRFLDLQAQVALFEARLPQLTAKEMDQTLATLTEALTEPQAVGDLDALRARVETLRERSAERRKELAAEREAAKAQALADRTVIVERAEEIAAADPAKVHWRSSGDELRNLLEQWKQAQRSGPRLDRPTEDALWKRFSRARTTFDRNRGHYFSQLDAAQAEAKRVKEQLVAEAQALSSSTDWGRTSAAYRDLMDRWKAAGRASRKDDDALWAQFRDARQTFFDARQEQNAQIDAEYGENLKVKLALLEQAEALLPVRDPVAAKAALRPIQDKWEAAGRVPRGDVQRIEARMRAVEQAVRDADQDRWRRTDPEKKARAEGAAAQLYDAIDALEKDLAEAKAAGDAKAEQAATEALEARRAWLDQVLRAAGD